MAREKEKKRKQNKTLLQVPNSNSGINAFVRPWESSLSFSPTVDNDCNRYLPPSS